MIRMLLEDMLSDLGYTVAAQAGRIEEALEAAKHRPTSTSPSSTSISTARPSAPVAEALAARGTPFVFATGYGEHGLPEPYRDRPTLKKPFQIDGLSDAAKRLTAAKTDRYLAN